MNYFQSLIDTIQLRDQVTNNFELLKHYALFSNQMSFDFPELETNEPSLESSNQLDINQFEINELEKIIGINRMLAFELVEKIDASLSQEDFTAKMFEQMSWLERTYAISLSRTSLTLIEVRPDKTLHFCLNYEKIYDQQQKNKFGDIASTHDRSNYLVLILELI